MFKNCLSEKVEERPNCSDLLTKIHELTEDMTKLQNQNFSEFLTKLERHENSFFSVFFKIKFFSDFDYKHGTTETDKSSSTNPELNQESIQKTYQGL